MNTLDDRPNGLVPFLPIFERGEVSFDPYRQHSETHPTWLANGDQFLTEAYRLGWVDPKVDWIAWANSEEGRKLLTETGVEHAHADDLVCVMTTVIRQERFVEGSLEARYQSGYLTAVLRRMLALLDGSAKPQ